MNFMTENKTLNFMTITDIVYGTSIIFAWFQGCVKIKSCLECWLLIVFILVHSKFIRVTLPMYIVNIENISTLCKVCCYAQIMSTSTNFTSKLTTTATRNQLQLFTSTQL